MCLGAGMARGGEVKSANVARLSLLRPIRRPLRLRSLNIANIAKLGPPGLAMLSVRGQRVN